MAGFSTSICTTILFIIFLHILPCQSNKTIQNITKRLSQIHYIMGDGDDGPRRRRNLANMGWMADCAMREYGNWTWAIEKLMFNYGCYCGWGAWPFPPVDGIDECCRIHDDCFGEYDTVIWDKCCVWWVPDFTCGSKYEHYKWKCNGGYLHCKTKAEGNNECEIFLCECDKKLMDCWRQYPVPTSKIDCNKSAEWSTTTIPVDTTSTTTESTTTITIPTTTTEFTTTTTAPTPETTSITTIPTTTTETTTTTTITTPEITTTISTTPETTITTTTTAKPTNTTSTTPKSTTTVPTTTSTISTTTATTSTPVPTTTSSTTTTTTPRTTTTTTTIRKKQKTRWTFPPNAKKQVFGFMNS